MINLFIRNGDPRQSELARHFDELFAVAEAVEAALATTNLLRDLRVSGGKKPDELKDQATWYERERRLGAARHQLRVAAGKLEPLMQPLADECKRLRDFVQKNADLGWFGELGDQFMTNILIAEELYDLAVDYRHRFDRFTTSGVTSELFWGLKPDAEEWVFMTSGHGSEFVFVTGDSKRVPPGPYWTEEEANLRGWRWECFNDTFGGLAMLYNVRTGKKKPVVNPKEYGSEWVCVHG
jgi:hypothetical protein